jgi:hypothetical protein
MYGRRYNDIGDEFDKIQPYESSADKIIRNTLFISALVIAGFAAKEYYDMTKVNTSVSHAKQTAAVVDLESKVMHNQNN